VLYVDSHGVPGSAAALEELSRLGFQLVFATNNSTKTPESVVAHLMERIGFAADPEAIVTSGMATARFLAADLPRVLLLGPPALGATLRDEGIELTSDWRQADAIVSGLDLDLSYRRLADAVLAVGRGARFIATNVDNTYPTPEGLYPGGGAIAAAVTVATGVEPEVCGKPHEPMRSLVRAMIGDGPVWVVGDRPETDLEMGAAEGWTRVLVLTGVTSGRDVRDGVADVVLDTIANLPEFLAEGLSNR